MVVIDVSFGLFMYLLRLIVCIISNVSGHSNLNIYHRLLAFRTFYLCLKVVLLTSILFLWEKSGRKSHAASKQGK